jgi:hypothetical protein
MGDRKTLGFLHIFNPFLCLHTVQWHSKQTDYSRYAEQDYRSQHGEKWRSKWLYDTNIQYLF